MTGVTDEQRRRSAFVHIARSFVPIIRALLSPSWPMASLSIFFDGRASVQNILKQWAMGILLRMLRERIHSTDSNASNSKSGPDSLLWRHHLTKRGIG